VQGHFLADLAFLAAATGLRRRGD